MKRAAIAGLLILVPGLAGADYLYNAAGAGSGPRVIIAVDSSFGANGVDKCDDPEENCLADGDPTTCPWGDDGVGNCKTRYDGMMAALQISLPRASGTEFAAVRFGDIGGETTNTGVSPDTDSDDCDYTEAAPMPSPLATVLSSLNVPVTSRGGDARPIGEVIDDQLEDMVTNARSADTSPFADCRPYAVIFLTTGRNGDGNDADGVPDDDDDGDGDDDDDECGDMSHLPHMDDSSRLAQVFFVGVGDLAAATHTVLDRYARVGKSALKPDDTFCQLGASCTSGTALYADSTTALVDNLDRLLASTGGGEYSATAPIIGTVPQELTEVGRVSMNFMLYSSFTMPGYEGHLYGIRLFKERSANSEQWDFTDFTQMDLDNCGVDPDNPCVFDAGARLTTRSTARRIFTGDPGVPFDAAAANVTGVPAGAFTVPIASLEELSNDTTGRGNLRGVIRNWWGESATSTSAQAGIRDRMFNGLPSSIDATVIPKVQLLGDGTGASDGNIDTVINWLHGGAGSGRAWKLGDLYHSTPAAAEKPSYRYEFPGYATFKNALANRPMVAYIGANDGMIHAFFVTPDFEKQSASATERWEAGDELAAYLPLNMVAKASARILEGEEHFFSMDMACRIDDIFAISDVDDGAGGEDCSQDTAHPEWCGWRTIAVCGEGWGGAWYVALDITQPMDPSCTTGPCDPMFVPLWEYTNHATGGAGLGKTWSTPGSGLVRWDDGSGNYVRSILVMGSGYNNQMYNAAGSNASRGDYRLLNMPFPGVWPQHGRGTANNTDIGRLFVLDAYTGQQLASFDAGGNSGNGLQAVVADIPLADLDRDRIVDIAYAGGWRPNVQRIAFHDSSGTVEGDDSDWSADCVPMSTGSSKPISSRPALIVDRGVPGDADDGYRVYSIVGTGLDENSGPDRFAGGDQWEMIGYSLMDTGKSGCRSDGVISNSDSGNSANMCTAGPSPVKFNGLLDGGRMLGAPIMQIQPNSKRWLTFMSNDPASDPCEDPAVRLYCVAFFSGTPGTCDACSDLDNDGDYENGDGTNDDAFIEIDTGGQIGGSPAMADGQIYVATTSGPMRLNNADGTGDGGGNANQGQPRALAVAWREIYP